MFLEQSRRKTISESFLRYSVAKYVGTPRRQIGAGLGLALMIFLSWLLLAQLYGKAANVAYQQSLPTGPPTGVKPGPSPVKVARAAETRPVPATSSPAVPAHLQSTGNENIVSNADFEKSAGDMPLEWEYFSYTPSGSSARVVADDRAPEHRCFLIENKELDDSNLSQAVMLAPGAVYKLGGRIKTQKVVNQRAAGAFIWVEGDVTLKWLTGRYVTGTHDWQPFAVEIRTPARFKPDSRLFVECRLGDYGDGVAGKAWFADVRLDRVSSQRSVLAFNGEQGGIRVKYNPIFDVRTAMTVEAWIRVEDPPGGIIVTRDNPKLGPWQFIFSDKGLLRADVAWGNWNLTPESSCRAIPTRKWIHVAMVYDGRVVRNYVSGKKVVSFPTCEKLLVNDNDIRIGYAPVWPVATGRTFKGQIAEVRLSGAALYDRDFIAQPRLAKVPSTLLLLPLDEGSGSIAKDASGHGNDGVITNGTWVTASREEFQIAASIQGSVPQSPATAVGDASSREATVSADAPRRVLLDMSHDFAVEVGNGLCDPQGYLRPRGYLVKDTQAGLREDVLKAFDVLVLYQHGAPAQYTQKDVDCVKAFLERGGGVMIYAEAGSSADQFPLNRIAREFGLAFLPDQASGAVTATSGFGNALSYNARLLRIDAGANYKPIALDSKGRPVIVSLPWKAGRIVAVSGANLFSNPWGKPFVANAATINPLFDWLASKQVADESVDVQCGRIDPDRVVEAGGFRFLCPDPLPGERVNFLREKAAMIYSEVTKQFGYETAEQKTVIALMCAGSGWTASPTLMGIGVLGDEVVVASVLIHESSNSLCIETPVWLGDAGWSAYVQIKVKTAMGGRFAENVKGQLQRQIAEYHQWESAHGVYDVTSEKNIAIGEGKVLAILSEFEQKYGPDVMKRYFAAARKWKDDPAVSKYPPSDRAVFYFSLATGEDQYPYFKKLGTNVQRIALPEQTEHSASEVGGQSSP